MKEDLKDICKYIIIILSIIEGAFNLEIDKHIKL